MQGDAVFMRRRVGLASEMHGKLLCQDIEKRRAGLLGQTGKPLPGIEQFDPDSEPMHRLRHFQPQRPRPYDTQRVGQRLQLENRRIGQDMFRNRLIWCRQRRAGAGGNHHAARLDPFAIVQRQNTGRLETGTGPDAGAVGQRCDILPNALGEIIAQAAQARHHGAPIDMRFSGNSELTRTPHPICCHSSSDQQL